MNARKHGSIPLNKPLFGGNETDYVAQTIRSTIDGAVENRYGSACERWLEKELGCVRAFVTHSGTGALEMAALLCRIGPGDEVILPSFTFPSTANAFVLRGAVPVFVDIRSDTFNLDETLIDAAVTPRTRAIVPVHYGGVACAMNEILEIARTRALTVVEDAAHGILASYKGQFLGTLGNMGALSFHSTKNIVSGRGGALLLNDEDLVERAAIALENGTDRLSFLQGRVEEYSWQDVGSAFGMSEILSAFLYAQLEVAAQITDTRRRLFYRYREQLEPLVERGVIRVPHVPDGVTCNGHIFFLITRHRQERQRLIEYLRQHGVTAASQYVPLHLSNAGRRLGRVSGSLKVTEELVPGLVRLPLYPEMDEQEVNKVIDLVMAFYAATV